RGHELNCFWNGEPLCQRTLKEKINADFRPYVILGACNPPLAHRALSADLGIGLLSPCNVVVYDNGDGTSTVEAMDPQAALGLVGDNPAIAEVRAMQSPPAPGHGRDSAGCNLRLTMGNT